jgi:ferredoxin
MIFYFSCYGNSRFIASQLALCTGCRLVDISNYIKNRRKLKLSLGRKRVGVVFPVMALTVPKAVLEFVEELSPMLPEDSFKFAVCTYGAETGDAMRVLHGSFPFDSAWSILMPMTDFHRSPFDTEAVAIRKLTDARRRAFSISFCVDEMKRGVYDVSEGTIPHLKDVVTRKDVLREVEGCWNMKVDSKRCTGCGICVSNCPVGGITLENGVPVLNAGCIRCRACANSCPNGAIIFPQRPIGEDVEEWRPSRYNLKGYLVKMGLAEPERWDRSVYSTMSSK